MNLASYEPALFGKDDRIPSEKMSLLQHTDADIMPVIEALKSGKEVDKEKISKKTKVLWKDRRKLSIDSKGLLRRQSGELSQIVLPKQLKSLVYQHLHANMGHLGVDRVFDLARQRVYWPFMFSDISDFILKKCPCIAQKKPSRNVYAPLQGIVSSSPLELISMDYLHLETSSGGFEYILLIVDNFTRYAQAYATRNKSGLTAAKHLYGDYVLRFGLPSRIMHDQGREFENQLFSELHKLSGVDKSRTTPYHPESNGLVERMNRTLLQMLRTVGENQKKKWHLSLNKVIHAYNCTRQDTTNFAPYYLMFGRHPRLPLDFMLDEDDNHKIVTHSQFSRDWQSQMKEAYRLAFSNTCKQKESDKKRADKRPLSGKLFIGDRVLVKNVVERGGPGKIRSFWEQQVYIVIDTHGTEGVVYSIQKEHDNKSRKRTVHRNMLMPCADLKLDSDLCQKSMRVDNDHDAVKRHEKVDKPAELSFNDSIEEHAQEDVVDTESDELSLNPGDFQLIHSYMKSDKEIHDSDMKTRENAQISPVDEDDLQFVDSEDHTEYISDTIGATEEERRVVPDINEPIDDGVDMHREVIVDTGEPFNEVSEEHVADIAEDESIVIADPYNSTEQKSVVDEIVEQLQSGRNEMGLDIEGVVSSDDPDDDEEGEIDGEDTVGLISGAGTRHSRRMRKPPKKFQYDEIGKPVVREIQVCPKSKEKNRSLPYYQDVKSSVLNPNAIPYCQQVHKDTLIQIEPHCQLFPVSLPRCDDTSAWIGQYQIHPACCLLSTSHPVFN